MRLLRTCYGLPAQGTAAMTDSRQAEGENDGKETSREEQQKDDEEAGQDGHQVDVEVDHLKRLAVQAPPPPTWNQDAGAGARCFLRWRNEECPSGR